MRQRITKERLGNKSTLERFALSSSDTHPDSLGSKLQFLGNVLQTGEREREGDRKDVYF